MRVIFGRMSSPSAPCFPQGPVNLIVSNSAAARTNCSSRRQDQQRFSTTPAVVYAEPDEPYLLGKATVSVRIPIIASTRSFASSVLGTATAAVGHGSYR